MPRDQMVKGYEFSKDQYVTFTDDELKALGEEAQTGHRDHRVRARVRGRPDLLRQAPTTSAPTRAASSAYHLLAEAMRETGPRRRSPSGRRAASSTWC